MRCNPPTVVSRIAALGLAAVLLSGCSGGLGSLFAPGDVPTYDLAAPDMQAKSRRSSAQLVIPEPTALRSLESDRVVVKPGGGQVNYLDGAQWSDTLPKLLQARLIETLERARVYRAVTRPGSGIDPDYQLLVEIRNFEVVAGGPDTGEPATAHVALSVRLVPASSGRSVAQRIFEARAPLEKLDAANGTKGLNQALATVLADLTTFLARR